MQKQGEQSGGPYSDPGTRRQWLGPRWHRSHGEAHRRGGELPNSEYILKPSGVTDESDTVFKKKKRVNNYYKVSGLSNCKDGVATNW